MEEKISMTDHTFHEDMLIEKEIPLDDPEAESEDSFILVVENYDEERKVNGMESSMLVESVVEDGPSGVPNFTESSIFLEKSSNEENGGNKMSATNWLAKTHAGESPFEENKKNETKSEELEDEKKKSHDGSFSSGVSTDSEGESRTSIRNNSVIQTKEYVGRLKGSISLPENLFQDTVYPEDPRTVNLNNVGFEELFKKEIPPNTKSLYLKRNGISEIRPWPLKELEFLALDENVITKIKPESFSSMPSLKEISLNENDLKKIETELNQLEKLEKLIVSNNLINRVIGMKVSSLRILNLSGNQLKGMNFIENCPSLEDIDLSDNKLSQIEKLSSLKHLQKLNLSKNEIVQIDGIPIGVEYLYMRKNELECVQDLHVISNSLIELDLSKNKRIKSYEFLELEFGKLKSLRLSGNGIRRMKNFEGFSILKTLDLSKNKIKKLSGLGGMDNLQLLNLSNNRIEKIGDGFHQLTNLTELNLRKNLIIGKLEMNFRLIPSIEKLLLSGNKLEVVPEISIIDQCPKLKIIELKKCKTLKANVENAKRFVEFGVNQSITLVLDCWSEVCFLQKLQSENIEALKIWQILTSKIKEIRKLRMENERHVSNVKRAKKVIKETKLGKKIAERSNNVLRKLVDELHSRCERLGKENSMTRKKKEENIRVVGISNHGQTASLQSLFRSNIFSRYLQRNRRKHKLSNLLYELEKDGTHMGVRKSSKSSKTVKYLVRSRIAAKINTQHDSHQRCDSCGYEIPDDEDDDEDRSFFSVASRQSVQYLFTGFKGCFMEGDKCENCSKKSVYLVAKVNTLPEIAMVRLDRKKKDLGIIIDPIVKIPCVKDGRSYRMELFAGIIHEGRRSWSGEIERGHYVAEKMWLYVSDSFVKEESFETIKTKFGENKEDARTTRCMVACYRKTGEIFDTKTGKEIFTELKDNYQQESIDGNSSENESPMKDDDGSFGLMDSIKLFNTEDDDFNF